MNAHYDFRLGNILNTPVGAKLIDFESARTGETCYDFVKLWDDLKAHPKCWSVFLKGYASVRELPLVEKSLDYYAFDLQYGFLQWAIAHKKMDFF